MSDVVFVAVLLAFFALATLFVRGCDRVIGPDETELTGTDATLSGEEKTAA